MTQFSWIASEVENLIRGMAKILRALALLSVLCSKDGRLRLSVVIHTNANEYREASY